MELGWTKGIHEPQKRGSGEFRGDKVVDQERQMHASTEVRN